MGEGGRERGGGRKNKPLPAPVVKAKGNGFTQHLLGTTKERRPTQHLRGKTKKEGRPIWTHHLRRSPCSTCGGRKKKKVHPAPVVKENRKPSNFGAKEEEK